MGLQVKQSEAVPPEQVAQSEWQVLHTLVESAYMFDGHPVAQSRVGWRFLPTGHDEHSVELGPIQVAQVVWQTRQVKDGGDGG